MKRPTIILLIILFFAVSPKTFAIDTTLFNIRSKFFVESQDLRNLLAKSKDTVLVTGMFDSCIVAISQIDAYFSMLGILEDIKDDDLTETTLDIIIDWINNIKKTIDLNMQSLNAMPKGTSKSTEVYIGRLKGLFGELDTRLNIELNRLYTIKKALAIKVRRR